MVGSIFGLSLRDEVRPQAAQVNAESRPVCIGSRYQRPADVGHISLTLVYDFCSPERRVGIGKNGPHLPHFCQKHPSANTASLQSWFHGLRAEILALVVIYRVQEERPVDRPVRWQLIFGL